MATTDLGPGPLGLATPLGELLGTSDAQLQAEFDSYESLGVGWLRTNFWWDLVQPERGGTYDWRPIERVVEAAEARGIAVIGELNGVPSWVAGSGGMAADANVAAYADYAAAAARHFGGSVDHWEIGNEPNLSRSWFGTPDASDYTEVLKAAHAAIKGVSSGDTVILGGLSPAPETADGHIGAVDFLDRVYDSGGKGAFDAVGFHPYSWPLMPDDPARWNGWQIMEDGIRDTMSANGDGDKAVWMTEFGAPTGGGGNAVSEQAQAEMLRQAAELAEGYDWAGPILVYSFQDRGGWDSTENWFGLVRPDGSRKPAYDAFASVAAADDAWGGGAQAAGGWGGAQGSADGARGTIEVGAGADALEIRLSGDAWQGEPRARVEVDGEEVAGDVRVAASRAAGGEPDLLRIRGDWGPGEHTARVTFTNDAWGGTPETDRNLHVEGAVYNGAEVPGVGATLEREGGYTFGFTDLG